MGAGVRGSAVSDEEVVRLKAELAARVAESDWLKAHYDRHLREALDRLARQPAPPPPPPPPAAPPPAAPAEPLLAELKGLHGEVERMRLAERRYLDRIDELKEELASSRDGADARG